MAPRPASAAGPTRHSSFSRPSSAPNRKGSGQTRRSLEKTLERARRVTFSEGPADVQNAEPSRVRLQDADPRRRSIPAPYYRPEDRPSQSRPADPLPDSDDEAKGHESTVTLTPRSAYNADSRFGEAKWWHVPDARIEDYIAEESLVQDDGLSTKTTRSTAYHCPSSTCRALGNVGQPKRPYYQPNATWPLDGGQSEAVPSRSSSCPLASSAHPLRETVSGHVGAEAFAASSTSLRDIQVKDSVARGLPWQLEGRKPFDHQRSPKHPWTDSHLLLSQTKLSSHLGWADPGGGRCFFPGVESTVQSEQPKIGCLPGVTTPLGKSQRPQSGSGELRRRANKLGKSPTSPSTLSAQSRNSDPEVDLIQVELAFYENSDRICVLIHPEANVGPVPGSNEPDKMTLKGMIDKLTGMSVSKQRLLCKGFDVSADHRTLHKAGIHDGSTVTVHLRKELKQNRDTVVLACTAKRLEKQKSLQQRDSRRSSCIKESKSQWQGSKPATMVMPKWTWGIPPDNTMLGSGYNDLGKNSSFRFENHHIWYDQVNDRDLNDIREHPTYTRPVDYATQGINDH